MTAWAGPRRRRPAAGEGPIMMKEDAAYAVWRIIHYCLAENLPYHQTISNLLGYCGIESLIDASDQQIAGLLGHLRRLRYCERPSDGTLYVTAVGYCGDRIVDGWHDGQRSIHWRVDNAERVTCARPGCTTLTTIGEAGYIDGCGHVCPECFGPEPEWLTDIKPPH